MSLATKAGLIAGGAALGLTPTAINLAGRYREGRDLMGRADRLKSNISGDVGKALGIFAGTALGAGLLAHGASKYRHGMARHRTGSAWDKAKAIYQPGGLPGDVRQRLDRAELHNIQRQGALRNQRNIGQELRRLPGANPLGLYAASRDVTAAHNGSYDLSKVLVKNIVKEIADKHAAAWGKMLTGAGILGGSAAVAGLAGRGIRDHVDRKYGPKLEEGSNLLGFAERFTKALPYLAAAGGTVVGTGLGYRAGQRAGHRQKGEALTYMARNRNVKGYADELDKQILRQQDVNKSLKTRIAVHDRDRRIQQMMGPIQQVN